MGQGYVGKGGSQAEVRSGPLMKALQVFKEVFWARWTIGVRSGLSRVDHSFFQRDGLGHLDNRPKAVGEEGQPSLAAKYVAVDQASDDGPSSFQKVGLGRLDHSPKVAGGEGQPILATVWAPLAYKPPWDEPHIRLGLRLAFCKLRSGSPKRN
ncbi:hypothetical protein CK203_035273 [Vitis vinifera]|uniref:Uncharacterized protein n=1 Tax=Vitis vinifera TaxID=29760 RepID=A0A438HNB4_VITVI|nr:hypothetical protein CK203_035273 [Vitis vinifera]